MNNIVPNHLSHSLELDYKNRKRFLVDRVKIKRLIPGIIFGFLLFLLGIYESIISHQIQYYLKYN